MKSKYTIVLSSSQTLFTIPFFIFFFTLLNGYLLNLVSGYRANTWLVLIGVVVELAVVFWFASNHISVYFDPLEMAGFTVVTVGVWLYFIAPSLPTLLPPTQSSDAVRVYLQVLFSYPEGKLVSWYPAGGAFVTAMFARWLGWAPLRVVHLVAASFIALSAGAVYGMLCACLPKKRVSKISALIAPAILFVPWSYFAGILNWEQYFFAQAFAQYFILAALWYIASYAVQSHWIYTLLIGAALLGVVAAYPIFVALPLALFALVAILQWRFSFGTGKTFSTLGTLAIFIALMLLTAVALQHGGILELAAGKLSVEQDVGAGGVTNPSLENIGGPIFLLLVLTGVPLAWKMSAFGKTILGLVGVWFLQLVALIVIQPYLQISGYRVDKTFYILVFPLAILAALVLALVFNRLLMHVLNTSRKTVAGFITMIAVICTAVIGLRPPIHYAPFEESELQAVFWAKDHLNTYEINYIEPQPIRAYWLVFGLWHETLPNEWFQWIPVGIKLGPGTYSDWLLDAAWPKWLLVRDVESFPKPLPRIVYRNGASAILEKDVVVAAPPTPTIEADMYFGSTLKLIGYDLPRTTYTPGDTITLKTYAESIYPPPATVGWRLELIDRNGTVLSKQEGDPFSNKYPLQRWPPGKITSDEWALPLAPRAASGVYVLQLGLYRRSDGAAVDVHTLFSEQAAQDHFTAVPLAKIKIPLTPPGSDEINAAIPLMAHIGDHFALVRYMIQEDRTATRVQVTLYWQSLSKTLDDYTVFVHLLDASGRIVSQSDSIPRGGTYPTSIWEAGEIIKDEYVLSIPTDARTPLSIEIGMYTQPSLKRLPVDGNDHVLLTDIIR